MGNAIHGRNGALEVIVDEEPVAVGSCVEVTYDDTMEEVDTTAMGDVAKDSLAGLPSGAGTIRVRWNMADDPDEGQEAIEAAALSGDTIDIAWYPNGKKDEESVYAGAVTITGQSIRASVDSLIECMFSFRGFLERDEYTEEEE